jgi:hypothetical protein
MGGGVHWLVECGSDPFLVQRLHVNALPVQPSRQFSDLAGTRHRPAGQFIQAGVTDGVRLVDNSDAVLHARQVDRHATVVYGLIAQPVFQFLPLDLGTPGRYIGLGGDVLRAVLIQGVGVWVCRIGAYPYPPVLGGRLARHTEFLQEPLAVR